MKKIILTIFMMFIGVIGVFASEVIPTLKIISVNDNSVTLMVTSEYISDEDTCYIYRSVDGENYGNSVIVNCNEMYVDEDLESDTTYFYKASVGKDDSYSDDIPVTTKVSNLKEENSTKKYNPVMSFIVFILMVLFFLILLVGMLFFKKKLNK